MVWGKVIEPVVPEMGVTDLLGQLTQDARAVLSAEVAVQKARVTGKVARYKIAAINFAIAGVLGMATLIALLCGLILTLTPRVGPGFATLIVVGVMTCVIGLFAVKGLGALKSSPGGQP